MDLYISYYYSKREPAIKGRYRKYDHGIAAQILKDTELPKSDLGLLAIADKVAKEHHFEQVTPLCFLPLESSPNT